MCEAPLARPEKQRSRRLISHLQNVPCYPDSSKNSTRRNMKYVEHFTIGRKSNSCNEFLHADVCSVIDKEPSPYKERADNGTVNFSQQLSFLLPLQLPPLFLLSYFLFSEMSRSNDYFEETEEMYESDDMMEDSDEEEMEDSDDERMDELERQLEQVREQL